MHEHTTQKRSKNNNKPNSILRFFQKKQLMTRFFLFDLIGREIGIINNIYYNNNDKAGEINIRKYLLPY